MPLKLEPLLDKEKRPRKTDQHVTKHRVCHVPDSTADNLSLEFRADLYQAWDAIANHRYYENMAKVPNIGAEYTRTDDDSRLGVTKKMMQKHEQIIGPEWSLVLKDVGTYSGLDFAKTTEIVCPHMVSVRVTVYRALCQGAHAAAAMKLDDWFSPTDQVRGTLRLAFMVALRCLDLLQKFVVAGKANVVPLEDFVNRFQALPD
jgi:hypothetical protein